MKKRVNIEIHKEKLAEFCMKNHIKKLSLFGSSIHDDFRADSDVDILVEFEPDAHVGLIKFAGLELELSEILGRKVDLNTPEFISKYYREEVLAEAEVQYDAA
ncbi:nucleotidyltransferase family protein [Thermodesulfobacteriota bacterium]